MLATYGFALIGIPFFIAYAACISFAAHLVSKHGDRNTST